MRSGLLAATAIGAIALVGCSSGASPAGPASHRLQVVAAENFWGSIASQLGGERVRVASIVTNPNTDPHDYEPTPADGRVIATASYVIENGIGYDPWVPKLLDANPSSGRAVLDIGDLVGVRPGGNPHRWYSPTDVERVIEEITATYKRLDPSAAGYFDAQRTAFTTTALAHYHSLIDDIRAKYAGTPVGASESIVSPLAQALDLDLITPSSFLEAISEGSEPTAADKTTIDRQIRTHAIKVYVFNSQNGTPDVRAQVDEARAAGIPTVTITETLAPATATFQDWQTSQLEALQAALAKATGK